MFLHRRGARVFLLHTYRDGSGAVRQQRLAHLEGLEELQQKLDEWERWQGQIQRAYPRIRADWGRMRERAERLARETDWPRARGRRDSAATPEDVAMERCPPSSSAIACSKAKVVGVPTRP